MVESSSNTLMRGRMRSAFAVAALLIVTLAAYANHFQNDFHFDDSHALVNNAAIRELRNIPLFFRDATLFSAMPSNQSYRPLVSALLAIDYKLAGGLHAFWFHFSTFLLFSALVLLLIFFIYRLLENDAPSPWNFWIALGATAWYALHPANADTVNYIIAATGEIISTLGVIASFAFYLAFPRRRRSYLFVLPAAITILAKPPAAIFAVLFAVYRLIFPDQTHKHRALSWVVDVLPAVMISGAILCFVQHMIPKTWVAGAASASNYLITQPYVALLYFKTFFWPTDLSADYDLEPFRTLNAWRCLAGFGFVGLFSAAAIAAAVSRKMRIIGFGLLWFLIALLPTSLFPLSEPMNDHRTFLPYIGLVVAAAGVASWVLGRRPAYHSRAKIAVTVAILLFLGGNGFATFERNKVWETEESLWHDVTVKSPRNGRGLMNYGSRLMARGDFAGAIDYFHRAQEFTPFYSLLFINLAIAEDASKQAPAEEHFAKALELDPSSPDSYTYFARYFLVHARVAEALPMLRTALWLSPTDVLAQELLAKASSLSAVNQSSAEWYLALSLQRYGQKRFMESLITCQVGLALKPDYAEAWNQLCAVCNKLARYDQAVPACEEALRLKPGFEPARNNLQRAREMAETQKK